MNEKANNSEVTHSRGFLTDKSVLRKVVAFTMITIAVYVLIFNLYYHPDNNLLDNAFALACSYIILFLVLVLMSVILREDRVK